MLTDTQRADLVEATFRYQADVVEAADYLLSRGITGEIAQAAHLGVVSDPMVGHEPYAGRLAIPYITVSGPVDIRFRCIEDHSCKGAGHGKYLSQPGHTPRLFNTYTLEPGGPVAAITEGEFDALIVHHYLGIPCIGVPGAQVWSKGKHYPRMLAGFQRVLVFADADEPGRDMARLIARDVQNATVVHLDEGLDVTDQWLVGGADDLRRRAGL